MKGPGLLLQQGNVVVGGEGQHPVAAGGRHLQGLPADGAGGAQNRQRPHAPAPLLKAGSQRISRLHERGAEDHAVKAVQHPPVAGKDMAEVLDFPVCA